MKERKQIQTKNSNGRKLLRKNRVENLDKSGQRIITAQRIVRYREPESKRNETLEKTEWKRHGTHGRTDLNRKLNPDILSCTESKSVGMCVIYMSVTAR